MVTMMLNNEDDDDNDDDDGDDDDLTVTILLIYVGLHDHCHRDDRMYVLPLDSPYREMLFPCLHFLWQPSTN